MDIYGELLTEKQKDILSIYYNDDLSLAEIAELTGNSRQAAYDIIKRCSHTLNMYEDKLHILKNSLEAKDKKNKLKNKLMNILDKSQEDLKDSVMDAIKDIENF